MRFGTSLGDTRPVKARYAPAISNAAATAALITGALFGFVGTTGAQIPTINVDKTCRAAAGTTISLRVGESTTEQHLKVCLDSEQKAREQIIKDYATYSSADTKQCINTDVYLPSYVEWLTCLEMERNLRRMKQEQLRR
jgi:hypothetical protein